MGSSLFVDYDLLNQSISSISEFSHLQSENQVLTALDSAVSEISSISSMHDGCFDGINADHIYQNTDDVVSGISQLVGDIQSSLSSSIEYSLGLGDKKEMQIFDTVYMIDHCEDKGFSTMPYDLFADYMHQKFGRGETPLSEIISKDILVPGYETKYYNDALQKMNEKLPSTRLRVVADSLYLATEFPHISYFWAAGHQKNIDGVNPDWGVVQYDKHFSENRVFGLDCSGFVNWALYNGGVSTDLIDCKTATGTKKDSGEKSYYNLGESEKITSEGIYNRVQPGDIAYMKGHIGMVVYKDHNCFTIAHVCDSDENIGMCLTKIDTTTGLIVDDSSKPDRIGEKYFTDIVEVQYEDEKNKA